MKLDLASFLLQWSTGGLAGLWITTRRGEVGLGYGWLLRSVFGVLAAFAAVVFFGHSDPQFGDRLGAAMALATAVAATVGIVVSATPKIRAEGAARFPAALDLVAPAFGLVGLFGAAQIAGGGYALAAARLVCGAAFLGAVSDAMLLGHWYLVQPGLRREPLIELVRITGWVWPLEVGLLLVPTGMISVLDGTIDDGYNGILGWVWIACAVFTIGLVAITRVALRERYYSAVMSATGLLYLAILTAFGTDLVARAVLAP